MKTRVGKGIINSSLWKSGDASQALGFAVDGLDISQHPLKTAEHDLGFNSSHGGACF